MKLDAETDRNKTFKNLKSLDELMRKHIKPRWRFYEIYLVLDEVEDSD